MTPFFRRAKARASGRRGRKRGDRRSLRGRGPQPFRLGWEALESRALLSANFGFAAEGSQDVFQSGGFAVATDAAGDSYMLSTNAVYKYAPDGTQIWATTFTPTKTTFTGPPEGIALDGSGNVYISGTYGGGITPVFGSTSLPAGSTTNVFLAKLDSNGNFLWADGFAGAGGDYNNDSIGLAADSAGNTYLDGTFQGGASFGTFGLAGNALQNSAFVTKVDSQGNVVWAKGFVGSTAATLTSSIDARGIAIDGNGDIYATGGFTGMVDVNPTQPGTNVLTDSNFFNNLTEYVVKLDNNGNTLWSQQAQDFTGVFDNSVGTAIAVDNSGNVYTTGSYEDLVNFDVAGSQQGQLSNNVSPNDLFENGFVLKLNARGQFDWADALNVNVGTLLFAHVRPHGITVDAFGNVYTTGNFAGTVDFDPGPATFNLAANGFYDGIYVTAFNSLGQFGWAVTAGGNDFWDAGNGIAVSNDGAVHVAGTFDNTVDFDPGPGVFSLTPTVSGTGSFVWKLTQPIFSGTVWDDSTDQNGVLEPGEPAVAGAVVNLYASSSGTVNPSTSTPVVTTVTDSAGHYKLLPLTSTSLKYTVQVRPPVGFGFTLENAGAKGQTQSNVDLTGMSGAFAPTKSMEIDAGLIGTRHPFGWALPIATLGSTAATSIVTDAAGNIYVAGSFQGTQDFDPGPGTYLVTSGNFGNATNDFVAKYTPAGALLWVRTAASKSSQAGPDPNSAPKLALNPITGDVDVLLLVTGQTDFNVSAPGTNLVTPVPGASSTVVLWSIDQLGNFVSARSMVGGQADSVGGLAIDSSGNVYLAGTYINTADFDPGPGLKYFTSQGGDDIFVTKLTVDGVLAWTQTFGGTGNDQVKSLAVDSSGNVVITGSIQGTANFGSILVRGSAAPANTAFVAKLNGATPPAFVPPPPAPQPTPGGAPLWVVELPGFASSVGNGVAVNPATNEIYDTGTAYSSLTPGSTGTAYFWKLTTNGGSYQPATISSTGDSAGTGVVVDGSGNIWATGAFSGTANFDLYANSATVNLTSAGAHDAYLMKVGFNGFGLLQAVSFGGPGDDVANAAAVDGSGNVYLTGSSQGPANFDPGLSSLDTFTIGKAGEQDDFVARLNPPLATPPNVAPSFSLPLLPVNVLENSGAENLPGFVTNILPGAVGAPLGPKGENDQSLNFVVTNSNPLLFSVQPGIDPTGALTFTPALNQSGTAAVTVTLRDDSGSTTTQTFTINVQFVDLPPSFVVNPTLTKGGDQTVNEDSGIHVVPSWAASISPGPGLGDALPQNSKLQFLIADTNPSLYAPGGFPTIDATTGNLSYTLAPDASGTDTLTVTLKDSGLVADGGTATTGVDISAPLTFHINAQFVNDPPTFTPGSLSVTTNEDAGAVTIPGWASNISPGEGTNEQYQTAGLYFTLTNDHPELFSVLPAIDPATGNLTFTPKPDVVGADVTDHVNILLHDTAGTANGGVNVSAALPQPLSILVKFVDDPPTFTAGAAQSLRADTPGQQSVMWATNISPGLSNEASQASTLQFAITNLDHPELFSVPPAIDPVTGKLTYTLAPGEPAFVNGVPPAPVTAHFNVVLQDNGGAAKGGADSTPPAPLAITVGYTDVAPSFTMVGDPTAVDETTGPAVQYTDANWATNINKGAPDESWQTLSFQVSTTILNGGDADLFNPAKGGVPPAIDPVTGNLTFTPAPFLSGVANVAVTLVDNGVSLNGINYGGVGTSATKTFRITVTPVNTPPSFQLSSNTYNVDEDTQGIQSVAQFATGISPGLGPDEASQKLTFQVSPITSDKSEANTLFAIPPSIDPTTGALSYELKPNVDGTVNYNVTLQDNGGGNDTSAIQTLTFNVNFVNDPPVLTGLSDQVLLENTTSSTSSPLPVQSLPITLSPGQDANEVQQTWKVTISNDNPGLFTGTGQPTIHSSPQVSAPLTTGQGTTSGTFDYQLAPDRSGVANITVTLSDYGTPDPGGTAAPDSTPLTTTQTFRIIVTPVNTPPQFQINPSALDPTTGAVTALEDAGAQTLPNFLTSISPGADPAEVGQKVTFQVALQSSTNPSLFVIPPAIDANGQLTYTLAPNQNGSAVVSVVAHDDGGTLNGGVDTSQPQLFTINALYVNDPPTFTSSGPQTVNENAGVQRVPLWASNMSPGDGANEVGQTLHFVLTPNDPGSSSLFLIQPTIDSSGNLLYSPAPFANGTANFTVTLVDNGAATTFNGQTFNSNTSTPHPLSITINPVNAPPSFAEGLDQTVDEDSGPHSVPNWATAIKDGQGNPPNQPLTFSVQPADAQSAALFSAGPSIDSSGTLSFTPAPLAFGVGTFTATLSDGGSTANGGQSTSVAETFHITVNQIDHAPTVANPLANPTVNENPPNATLFASLANVFNDVDIPLGDKLTLSMAGPNGGSSNPSLVTATLSGTDPAKAQLTLNYQPNQYGTAVIDLRATDQSGKSVDDKINVTVLAVNQPPSFTARGDVQVSDVGGTVILPLWATNISAGPPNESSQKLTFNVIGNTNPALFQELPSVSAGSGSLTFATRPGITGTATITLVLQDDGGTANGGQDTSQPQTFNITVGAVPVVPVALPDSYLLGLGASDSATAANGVLANDTPAGNLTAKLVQGPAHGTLTLNADGSFTYVKGAGFDGIDQFSYEAVDGNQASSPVSVQLTSYEASIVDKVYRDVLGRPADSAGLQYWTAQIENGQQYGTVAQGIFESDERLDPIIDQYYQQFLMRPADPSGLAHWDQVWKQFGGPENVIAGMISSPEFFQAAGGTNSGWVSALYLRLLNRTADDQGLQYWTNLLNQNQLTRSQVVLSFEDSVENDKLLVTNFYHEYLKRDPKPDELAQAVAQMQAGASPRDIQIGIINSTEFRTTPAPPPDGTVQKLS